MSKYKISYNSPFILTFAFICSVIYFIKWLSPGFIDSWFVLRGDFDTGSFRYYFGLITYPLNHSSIEHLFGNMSFILLLGPVVEEKYGQKNLFLMVLTTTAITAIFNIILFDTGIIGASGIVFLFIVLISFINYQGQGIPLTFVLVVLIFIGKEIIASFDDDNISQFGHIVGGACGSIFGFNRTFSNHDDKHRDQ